MWFNYIPKLVSLLTGLLAPGQGALCSCHAEPGIMLGEEGIKGPDGGQSCSVSLAALFSVKLQENDSVHPCVQD